MTVPKLKMQYILKTLFNKLLNYNKFMKIKYVYITSYTHRMVLQSANFVVYQKFRSWIKLQHMHPGIQM